MCASLPFTPCVAAAAADSRAFRSRTATLCSSWRSRVAAKSAWTCSSRLASTSMLQNTCAFAVLLLHTFIGRDSATPPAQTGYTALMAAVRFGHRACVDLLIKAGADCNATDDVRPRSAASALLLGPGLPLFTQEAPLDAGWRVCAPDCDSVSSSQVHGAAHRRQGGLQRQRACAFTNPRPRGIVHMSTEHSIRSLRATLPGALRAN